MNQSKTNTNKTDTTDESQHRKPDSHSPSPHDNNPPANQNVATTPKTPKVQFGATETEEIRNSGSWRGNRKGKRSFKDIVLREVIRTNLDGERSWPGTVSSSSAAASAKKGILKLRGDSQDAEQQSLCFVNKAYIGDDDTVIDDVIGSAPPLSNVSVTDRSALLFQRRRSSETGFAGVVELLFQRSHLDSGKRDWHPFGRDVTVEAILEGGSAPKRPEVGSAYSKLVVWITLLCFLAGVAFGLVFLSETYNAKHRYDYLLKTSVNETQKMTS